MVPEDLYGGVAGYDVSDTAESDNVIGRSSDKDWRRERYKTSPYYRQLVDDEADLYSDATESD